MKVLAAVRAWLQGPGGAGTTTPRSRIALPSAHDVPPDVLRALWALDPRLDAYILPDGRVWLLLYEADRGRIAEGRKMLEREKAEGTDECRHPFVTARLMADGWSLLDELPYHRGTSAGAMVKLAQQALYRNEDTLKAQERDLRSIADSTRAAERRAAVISERIRSSSRSDWAWAYRGRRHFTGGLAR
jgi:hypothetical protein